MSLDPISAAVVMGSGAIVMAVGAYGMTSSRNLVRQLLSVEVMFNGLLMIVLPLLSSMAASATYFGVVVVSVVSAEVIIAMAILIGYYRSSRTASSEGLEEVRA